MRSEGKKVEWDLIVIGSGAAGFAGAITATELGAKVLMVEKSNVGGTCVNVGCIPSKTFLSSSNFFNKILNKNYEEITIDNVSFDLKKLKENKDEIVGSLREKKYIDVAKEYGFQIISGAGSFVDENTLEVNGHKYSSSNFLIATGAKEAVPEIKGLFDVNYLTYRSALELDYVPETIAIIGANAIGLEFAQHFSNLGSKVILLEALDRIAPFEEPEISEALSKRLKEASVEILTSVKIIQLVKNREVVKLLVIKNGREIEVLCSDLLVATGRRPDLAGLGLENTSVVIGEKGEVKTNDFQQTNVSNIWAAGDVTSKYQYVYVAAAQGRLAALNMFNHTKEKLNYLTLPRVIFSSPTVGSAGLTEDQARKLGYDPLVSILNFTEVARPVVNRDKQGIIKMVADSKTEKILGVHTFGDQAEELIQNAVYILEAGFTISQISSMWAVYLSYSEAIKLAAQSFSRDVSKLSCCAS